MVLIIHLVLAMASILSIEDSILSEADSTHSEVVSTRSEVVMVVLHMGLRQLIMQDLIVLQIHLTM